MTIEQVLARMLERFDGGRRWAPCHAADAEGKAVPPWTPEGRPNPAAKRGCVVAMAASVTGGPFVAKELLDAVQDRMARAAGLSASVYLAGWNDSRANYGEIEAMLRAAIEDGK